MSLETILQVFAVLALVFSVGAFAYRLRVFNSLRRPVDSAPTKGSRGQGILYAYTLGMMPWAKRAPAAMRLLTSAGWASTWASSWAWRFFDQPLDGLPALHPAHFAGGRHGPGRAPALAGIIMRYTEPGLKAISTGDDFFAVLIVSLFPVVTSLWLAGVLPIAVFYLVSALMLVYAPFGKIRHCIYFAYSRLFYGKFMVRGRAASQPASRLAEGEP